VHAFHVNRAILGRCCALLSNSLNTRVAVQQVFCATQSFYLNKDHDWAPLGGEIQGCEERSEKLKVELSDKLTE
jgi:hypothetical protein